MFKIDVEACLFHYILIVSNNQTVCFTFRFRPFFKERMSAVELEDSTKVRVSAFMTQRACSVTLESMLTSFLYHLLFLLRLDPSVYFSINIYYSNILARIKACQFCL